METLTESSLIAAKQKRNCIIVFDLIKRIIQSTAPKSWRDLEKSLVNTHFTEEKIYSKRAGLTTPHISYV